MITITTLKEELNKLDGSTRVKIGSFDGSSYFYCGTVGEFREKIDEYSEQARQFFADGFNKAADRFEEMKTRFPEYPQKYLHDLDISVDEWLSSLMVGVCNADMSPDHIKALGLKRFIEDVSKWMAMTDQKRKAGDAAAMYLAKFKPFGERYIMDIFFSSVDEDRDDVLVIKVEGYECGAYWSLDEAKNKPHFVLKPVSSVLAADETDRKTDVEVA